MHEENILILPTFIFKISAGIGQRKTLMVQESEESFPKLFKHLVLTEKETEAIEVILY